MSTSRVTVELDADAARALEVLAARDQVSLNHLISLAVRDYLARRTIDDADWRRRWGEVIASLRSGVPDGVTPEDVEAEVRAARAEYRAERRARHR